MRDRPPVELASGQPVVSRWRRLGWFLPRDVRERVFEPAYEDLTRAWVTSAPVGERPSFGLRAVALLVLVVSNVIAGYGAYGSP